MSAYLETDPVGDFLPSYTGAQHPGLDVVSYEAVLVGDRLVIAGEMAGAVADTQAVGGLYVIGFDRGRGTPRFLSGTPQMGPNVLWDLIVRVNPDGTGLVNNQVAGVSTPLDRADITISGNHVTARVPLSLLVPAATRPPEEWTYNLWPRDAIVPGRNEDVSDLGPDDGNAPVRVVAPARVAGVAVNDGSAQRSRVDSFTVTFDAAVTIDPGAFGVSRIGDDGGSAVDVQVAASVVDGRTVATLTFAGPDVVGGSVGDGDYRLTVDAARVHDRWGRELDGDGDGAARGDRVDGFTVLFGDADGWPDREQFRGAFGTAAADPGYRWYFDLDADGDVDGRDNREFNRRFGDARS